jgi:hypothetical protein
MTAKGGPFMVVVEANYPFERSAKAVSEARIARTGCIHFLIQACRLMVHFCILTSIITIITNPLPKTDSYLPRSQAWEGTGFFDALE